MKKFKSGLNTNDYRDMVVIIILIICFGCFLIYSSTLSRDENNKPSVELIETEVEYQLSCGSYQALDIVADPEAHIGKRISFTANISEMYNDYFYQVSDINLADDGGLWVVSKQSTNIPFKIDDIVIIYGEIIGIDDLCRPMIYCKYIYPYVE